MADRLTEDVWIVILQQLSHADRLGRCALVCQKLGKAAAAATAALEVSMENRHQQQRQQLARALDSYLLHHGSNVTSLICNSGSQPLTQLPCPRLLHLELVGTRPVQLGKHGGLPGVLRSCATGLTSLQLSQCTLTRHGGLSRLSVLVALRHLQMQFVQQPGAGYATLPGSVLPSLAHLTRLDLNYVGGVQDVQHVSSLTNLSVLSVRDVFGSQPLRLARDITPGFVLPASLQQLCLGHGVVLAPAVLAAATQLTCVKLDTTVIEGQGGGVSSGAALLAAVAELQRLDTLVLRELRGVVWPAPSAAYTALTASSKLQKLVCGCRLPEGVWEHVFPPACPCPALREFDVQYGTDWRGAEAASSLVRCCPGLQQLHVSAASSLPLVALRPLTALTGLVACMKSRQADDIAGSVAAL